MQYVPRTLLPIVRRRIRVVFWFRAVPIGRHEICCLVPRRSSSAIIDVHHCVVSSSFGASISRPLDDMFSFLVPFPHGGHISCVAFESQVTFVAFSIRRNHVPS